MAEEREDKDMTGALFVNSEKTKPAQPDHRGNITIDGVKYWIAAWKKQARESGKSFLSLKAERADQPRQQQRPANSNSGRGDEQRADRGRSRDEEEDDFFNQ